MALDEFKKKADEAISALRERKGEKALVAHHCDADGLCSGAITKLCLEREGYEVDMLCLEKVYPEVIEDIHSRSGRVLFYSDIGSSHGDMISKCNAGKNLVIILDHHDPVKATDPKVFDLNLEYFGFKGETDFSGATCCYLFAKALDEKNIDLAYIALVGSCEIPEGFLSINKMVLEEAEKNGIVKAVGKSIKIAKLGMSIHDLFSSLQILGPVGYYANGPELGVKACIEGITPDVKSALEELEERRRKANKVLLARLYREGLNETEHIQWFDSKDIYEGMGTKVVGTFCSFLSFQHRLIKPDKYIFGLVKVPTQIPRWGNISEDLVKISVRVPKQLQKLIEQGKMPGAADLLREASRGFGVADGHEFAANVTIPATMHKTLIQNAESVIAGSLADNI